MCSRGVRDELVWSSPFTDVVFKCVHELLVSFDSVGIGNQCFGANKDDGAGTAIVHSRFVGAHEVRCHRFVASGDIESRIRRLVGTLEQGSCGKPSTLGSVRKCLLNRVNRKPAKERTKGFVVGLLVLNNAWRHMGKVNGFIIIPIKWNGCVFI